MDQTDLPITVSSLQAIQDASTLVKWECDSAGCVCERKLTWCLARNQPQQTS